MIFISKSSILAYICMNANFVLPWNVRLPEGSLDSIGKVPVAIVRDKVNRYKLNEPKSWRIWPIFAKFYVFGENC